MKAATVLALTIVAAMARPADLYAAEFGFQLGPEELEHAYSLLTAVADKKKTIEDADLHEIIQTARTKKDSVAAS